MRGLLPIYTIRMIIILVNHLFTCTGSGKSIRRTIHVLDGVSHDGAEVDMVVHGKVALDGSEKLTS